MAKTMRNIVIVGISMILVAAALVAVVVCGGCSAMSSASFESIRVDALNTVIEATGLKTRIDSDLRERGYELVEKYGLPDALADQLVDSLAIGDWEVTSKPQDVAETSRFTLDVENNPLEITTYDDNSVVSVGAYGQEVTFAVPEPAQVYMPYVQYLQYLQLPDSSEGLPEL